MMAFDCAHEKKHGVKDPGAMNIERERVYIPIDE